jgi:Na+-translocating ferredoxin:NAD+ oxidoreductase RnfE subunit
MLTPGRKSSEYFKALRAEVLGALVLIIGVVVALATSVTERALVGLSLAALGAIILTKANAAYSAARGGVKAASVRKPDQTAPVRL